MKLKKKSLSGTSPHIIRHPLSPSFWRRKYFFAILSCFSSCGKFFFVHGWVISGSKPERGRDGGERGSDEKKRAATALGATDDRGSGLLKGIGANALDCAGSTARSSPAASRGWARTRSLVLHIPFELCHPPPRGASHSLALRKRE